MGEGNTQNGGGFLTDAGSVRHVTVAIGTIVSFGNFVKFSRVLIHYQMGIFAGTAF